MLRSIDSAHGQATTICQGCSVAGADCSHTKSGRHSLELLRAVEFVSEMAGMAWMQSTCTIRLNHRHPLFGHVLSGRYKAQLVEGSGNGYLRTACDYAHGVAVPPVRARSN